MSSISKTADELFVFKHAEEVDGVEKAVFEDGRGGSMICPLKDVYEIAAGRMEQGGIFSALPSREQAIQAMEVLGLHYAS